MGNEKIVWRFWDTRNNELIYPSDIQSLKNFGTPRYVAMRQFRDLSSGRESLYDGDIILIPRGETMETFLLRHDGILEGEFHEFFKLDVAEDYVVLGNRHELKI